MDEIYYALFSLEQLEIIAHSEKSENDQLRPLNDTALAVMTRDMAKHGFDHSKQGEILISVLSRHMNMFRNVSVDALEDHKILNLSEAMIRNMKKFYKFEGSNDALKEMVFTDGRHRHKVARLTYPNENIVLHCKILVDVSQKEGRLLSYAASREAQGVIPCFLDANMCLFSEELDTKEKEDMAERLGCRDDLSMLNVFHETLHQESKSFIQQWRDTGLFSIENMNMKKNKNFTRMLIATQRSDIKRRGRPNTFGDYFRASNISERDRALYQVLVVAMVVSVFQLSESEIGRNIQRRDIISRTCNAFVLELSNLIPTVEDRRMWIFKSRREPLLCLWKAGIRSLAETHNVDESTCHRQLTEVLQSTKDSKVPVVSLNELKESEDLFSSLKASIKKSPLSALDVPSPLERTSAKELLEAQKTAPVPVHVNTIGSPRSREDLPNLLEQAPEIRQESTKSPKVFSKAEVVLSKAKEVLLEAQEASLEAQEVSPEPREVSLQLELDVEGAVKNNAKAEESPMSSAHEDVTTNAVEALGEGISNMPYFDDTEDDALEILPKVDHIHKSKSEKDIPDTEDLAEAASPEVIFVGPSTASKLKPSMVHKVPKEDEKTRLRRSSRKATQKQAIEEDSSAEKTASDEIGPQKRTNREVAPREESPERKHRKGMKSHEKKLEKKVACALSCFNMAENLVEMITILQVHPTGARLLPSLTRCSTQGKKWAVFANGVDSLFDQSIFEKKGLETVLREFELNKYNIKDVFVLSTSYIEDLPDHLGEMKLGIATQKLFLSKEWSSKISEIPSMTEGHFIHYKKRPEKDTPEVTCVRLAKKLDTQDFRVYIEKALDKMKGMYGFVDALDQQTELIESVIALEKPREVLKLNEFSHSGKKSSCTYIYSALRKHVLDTCNCGGHAIMNKENKSMFNMHPMKDVLCEGVSQPFQMILKEEDEFFDVRPVSHYSLHLHSNDDTSKWSCDKTHMDDGARLEQGGFISYEDYQKCMKTNKKELKLVAGKSYIVDCESAMRDHKARLSPFHLRGHYVSGLFEEEFFLFFDDDSMASKFNEHHTVNAVEYATQVSNWDLLRGIYERGLGYLRECHLVIPTLNVSTIMALDQNSPHLMQCKKCRAIELFVNYGENYLLE